jgi:hypothetical protein
MSTEVQYGDLTVILPDALPFVLARFDGLDVVLPGLRKLNPTGKNQYTGEEINADLTENSDAYGRNFYLNHNTKQIGYVTPPDANGPWGGQFGTYEAHYYTPRDKIIGDYKTHDEARRAIADEHAKRLNADVEKAAKPEPGTQPAVPADTGLPYANAGVPRLAVPGEVEDQVIGEQNVPNLPDKGKSKEDKWEPALVSKADVVLPNPNPGSVKQPIRTFPTIDKGRQPESHPTLAAAKKHIEEVLVALFHRQKKQVSDIVEQTLNEMRGANKVAPTVLFKADPTSSDSSYWQGLLITRIDDYLAQLWDSLPDELKQSLQEAGLVGAEQGLGSLQITNGDLVDMVNENARDWANNRAAEMVGKRWVNGVLVDNPNAKWVISDTTRDQIQTAVTQAFEGETPIDELQDRIRNLGAFSDTRAEMIARTEVANAEISSNWMAWEESGLVEEISWIASNGPGVCQLCITLEAESPYPIMTAPRPISDSHPNCRCVVIASKLRAPNSRTQASSTEEVTKLAKARKLEGRINFQGLNISIENDKGSTRSGVGRDGKPWSVTMSHPYGYIRMTQGVDGDHVDCFVGPNPEAKFAYIIHTNDYTGRSYDEDKVMHGFDSPEEAQGAFLANFNDAKYFRSIEEMPMDEFKRQVLATKGRPAPVTSGYIARVQKMAKRDRKPQGRMNFQGLRIVIENYPGTVRHGVNPDNVHWRNNLSVPYGYIENTEGTDGDEVDCFVGPNMEAENAYIIHATDPKRGRYDEDKVVLGVDSPEDAMHIFLRNYGGALDFSRIETMPMDEFREKVLATNMHREPITNGEIAKDPKNAHIEREIVRAVWAFENGLPVLFDQGLAKNGWIGVDFDGTLAHTKDDGNPADLGDPIPEMVDKVKEWLAEGKDVRIFTARVTHDPTGEVAAAIEEWCEEHLGSKLPVTNIKDPKMKELYDDRAYHVGHNTGVVDKIVGGRLQCAACECGDCLEHTLAKFDPYHDEKGRFTTGPGGGGALTPVLGREPSQVSYEFNRDTRRAIHTAMSRYLSTPGSLPPNVTFDPRSAVTIHGVDPNRPNRVFLDPARINRAEYSHIAAYMRLRAQQAQEVREGDPRTVEERNRDAHVDTLAWIDRQTPQDEPDRVGFETAKRDIRRGLVSINERLRNSGLPTREEGQAPIASIPAIRQETYLDGEGGAKISNRFTDEQRRMINTAIRRHASDLNMRGVRIDPTSLPLGHGITRSGTIALSPHDVVTQEYSQLGSRIRLETKRLQAWKEYQAGGSVGAQSEPWGAVDARIAAEHRTWIIAQQNSATTATARNGFRNGFVESRWDFGRVPETDTEPNYAVADGERDSMINAPRQVTSPSGTPFTTPRSTAISAPGASQPPPEQDKSATELERDLATPEQDKPATELERDLATSLKPIERSGTTRPVPGWMAKPVGQRLSDSLDSPHLRMALEDNDIKLYGMNDDVKGAVKEFESKFGGVDPITYRQHLIDKLSQVAPVKKFHMDVGPGSSEVNSFIRTNDAEIQLNRTYNFTTGDVHHDLQIIRSRVDPSNAQLNTLVEGGGKAKALFEGSLDIYDNVGMKSISVYANINVGGFAWARYGFIPSEFDWADISGRIMGYSTGVTDPQLRSTLEKIAASTDPKSIRVLAALKPTDPGSLYTPISVGQRILLGSHWSGSIDLTDPESYAVTRAYVSGYPRGQTS